MKINTLITNEGKILDDMRSMNIELSLDQE